MEKVPIAVLLLVETVSVAVALAVPLIVMEALLQVGTGVPPVIVPQEIVTVPV
jgi:hypothetical protein